MIRFYFFFFQAEDGIRDGRVSRVQTCALPIFSDLDDSVADQPQLDAEALLLHREHVPVRIVPLFAESSNKSYFAALFEIGRASCRERGEISVVAGSL